MTTAPQDVAVPAAPTNDAAGLPPFELSRELLKTLQERFAVFRDYKPLAVGIDKQVLAELPETPRKVLRLALRNHTASTRYLKTMEKAETRLNLDGQPADAVTEEHRQHASELLRERFKKEAERQKAKRDSETAARKHAEKLTQLANKFGRHGK